MDIKDLIFTPIYLILFYAVAIIIKPFVTDSRNQKFFIAALSLRFIGAILLGIVYQYYYEGGDTFNFFENGSKWIWKAFQDNPRLGWQLIWDEGGPVRNAETYSYSQHIWYYRSSTSYFVVKVLAIVDLMTVHTYSASALFFAAFSFSGLWAIFSVLSRQYPNRVNSLAVAILFVPSVVFWGSGILKDTLTIGALGWLLWSVYSIFSLRRYQYKYWIALSISVVIIVQIKFYIILCFIPAMTAWFMISGFNRIHSVVLKGLLFPVILFFFISAGYVILSEVSEYSEFYNLDNLANRAAITAYDIRYGWGATSNARGGYDIGLPDGTIQGMISLFPKGVLVSLFRPFLWEVKTPLMLLSSLEASFYLLVSLVVLWKTRISLFQNEPFLLFCLVFALLFAFAVGVSTFNFGTLMRYKIPMLMVYSIFLAIASKRQESE